MNKYAHAIEMIENW
jgi:hypothetical protein